MGAKASYFLVFIVYMTLWICQQVACQSTHSLIILTDSYINLYKLLEVTLGLVHLSTQKQIASAKSEAQVSNLRLAGHLCTYQFKRLPVLGSFINGLFLAGLLLSAAIEGIQTCIHVGHSQPEGTRSILLQNPITYPSILVGFALVGLIMQFTLNRAHRMRESELQLTDSCKLAKPSTFNTEIKYEPDVAQLDVYKGNQLELDPNKRRVSDGNASQISLKSIRNLSEIQSIKATVPIVSSPDRELDPAKSCSTVHYCTSPVALTTCAAIVYFINNELVTEISDAVLATSVVILIFIASYPPMKASGKILLQTAPPELKVENLRNALKSASPLILEVRSLHLWSLTDVGDLVSTCEILVDPKVIDTEDKMNNLLRQVRKKALEMDVKCITIQPILEEPDKSEAT